MTFVNSYDAKVFLQNAIGRYQSEYVPRLRDMRQALAGKNKGTVPNDENDSLEAHVRNYLLDSVLTALNWNSRSDSGAFLDTLVPEMPIKSVERTTVRFIDYYGYDHATAEPLLVVEAKSPGSPLPSRARAKKPTSETSKRSFVRESLPEIILAGIKGEELANDWSDWLNTTRDYVRSVINRTGVCPGRVLMTNGDWFLLFLNPLELFSAGGTGSVEHIMIFGAGADPLAELLDRWEEVYETLSYEALSGKAPAPTLENLAFYVPHGTATEALHGLVVAHNPGRSVYAAAPSIYVAPVVFVRRAGKPWLRLNSQFDQALPSDPTRLDAHLTAVREEAAALATKIVAKIGVQPNWRSVVEHFSDGDSFKQLRGVRLEKPNPENPATQFVVVTGKETHFVLGAPTVENCAFHDWASAQQAGVAEPAGAPLSASSSVPPVWFTSGRVHHCAHRAVFQLKRTAVTPANTAECGPRSAKSYGPFCEIWGFEQHLCCRTCVFEKVCEHATVFTLPCQKPAAPPAAAPVAPAA